jgi:hypothetical protein
MLVLAIKFSKNTQPPDTPHPKQQGPVHPENGTENTTNPPTNHTPGKQHHKVRPTDRQKLAVNKERTNKKPCAKPLRKEVIQPHLPVRLPCYDFTPITDPTFDSSPPKGLGHWLRVLPIFVV